MQLEEKFTQEDEQDLQEDDDEEESPQEPKIIPRHQQKETQRPKDVDLWYQNIPSKDVSLKIQQKENMLNKDSNQQETSELQNKIFRLNVLYTNQLQKKKKTFNDGVLKVQLKNNRYICSLSETKDLREGVFIDRRQLETAAASGEPS